MNGTHRIVLYLAAVAGGFVLARRFGASESGLTEGPGGMVNPFTARTGPLLTRMHERTVASSPSAPAPSYPQALSTYEVVPGGQYAATVKISPPLSWTTDAGDVRKHAENKHFSNVQVASQKPVGWPGSQSGSYYVRATYLGEGRETLKPSYLAGQVKVVEAWRMA